MRSPYLLVLTAFLAASAAFTHAPAAATTSAPAGAATPAPEDTLIRTSHPERYEISISATKLNRRTQDVPNAMTVVRGDELRRRGTHTVAEALQDVVGFDTGEGSD